MTDCRAPRHADSRAETEEKDQPFYPDCSTCGHNASGVAGFQCTAFVSYPEGDPRGLAGYCGCKCTEDEAVRTWLQARPMRAVGFGDKPARHPQGCAFCPAELLGYPDPRAECSSECGCPRPGAAAAPRRGSAGQRPRGVGQASGRGDGAARRGCSRRTAPTKENHG